jgi:hypothetical protein
MTFKPGIGEFWAIASRRSASLPDVLRVADTGNWQDGVKQLIEMSPVVVVDTRVCTRALLFEASTVLSHESAYKAIFVSEDNGVCPVLERLFIEGGISADCLVSVVKEDDLGPLLQRLVVSTDTLPKPGRFAVTPSRMEEITARRGLRQPSTPFSLNALQGSHLNIIALPGDRKSLSTSLTPFWQLLAKGVVVQSLLSAAWGLWILPTMPQLTSTGFRTFVLWSVLISNWVACALYFYLARSLKKVCIAGDSLFVSDHLQECEIHISQISRVSGPDWTALRRITIYLEQPSTVGGKIVFAGKFFSAGMIARELRRRLYSHAEEKRMANTLRP